MKILAVLVVVCSVLCCEAQVLVADDTIAFSQIPNSSPYSGIIQCYGITCPAGTVHCSTRSERSPDYTKWDTTIECNDYNGNILSSIMKSSALSSPPFYSGQYNNYGSGGYNGYNGGSNDGYYNGDNYLYQWQQQH